MSEPRLELPERFNVAVELVDKNLAEGRGEKIAIYYKDQTINYNEVFRMVNKTGNAFKNLGLDPENRVLLLLLDCPEFVYSFFGAIKIGAVPIPANTILKPKDYLYLLNDSRAKIVVVSESLLVNIEEIKSELRYLKSIIVVGQAGQGYLTFNEFVQDASDQLEPADTHRDDPAFWLYSSGSTGFPKGTVHLQHDMIVASDFYAIPILKLSESDICYSVAKLFFAYGLGNGLYFPFRVGGSTVLVPEQPKPPVIYSAVKRYKPTLFFGVPTAYAGMLASADNFPDIDMSSIRYCVSAGEALPKTVFDAWFNKFNLVILDGIGSTEMVHIFITNRPGDVKPGATGKPVPGYQTKIIDSDGVELPAGEIGTLLVKGDSAAAFYWNKHEKTKDTFLGQWLNTGDKYLKDADGYFWYVGRNDDMIKPGGIWVSPIEVENTLLEHPAVLECAVIGVVDKDNLEKPKAYITLRDGITPCSELALEIQKFVKNKLAAYKFPRWVEFVDEIPKTASGKMLRYKLREMNKPQERESEEKSNEITR